MSFQFSLIGLQYIIVIIITGVSIKAGYRLSTASPVGLVTAVCLDFINEKNRLSMTTCSLLPRPAITYNIIAYLTAVKQRKSGSTKISDYKVMPNQRFSKKS